MGAGCGTAGPQDSLWEVWSVGEGREGRGSAPGAGAGGSTQVLHPYSEPSWRSQQVFPLAWWVGAPGLLQAAEPSVPCSR